MRDVDTQNQSKPVRRSRILVLGIGCELMGDDGIGIRVARELRRKPRTGVLVVDIGTAVLDAIPLLSWADRLLVVDAMRANGPPGTIYRASLKDVQSSVGSHSIHEFDLASAFSLMPEQERPSEGVVIGIEPASVAWGTGLSVALLETVPEAVRMAEECLCSWRKQRRRLAQKAIEPFTDESVTNVTRVTSACHKP